MKLFAPVAIFAVFLLCFAACTHHTVETKSTLETQSKLELAPVEVKPIHIVVDVNIRIQEELKKKFEKEDEIAKQISEQDAEEALRRYLSQASKKN